MSDCGAIIYFWDFASLTGMQVNCCRRQFVRHMSVTEKKDARLIMGTAMLIVICHGSEALTSSFAVCATATPVRRMCNFDGNARRLLNSGVVRRTKER